METVFKNMTNAELAEYICDILYVEVMDNNLSFSHEVNDDKGGVIFVDLNIEEFEKEHCNHYWDELGVESLSVSIYDEDENEIKIDYNFENYVENLLKEYFN